MAKQLTVIGTNTAKYKWILDGVVADGLNLADEYLEFVDINGERVSLNRAAWSAIQVGVIQPENLP